MPHSSTARVWAIGGLIFAATMMVMLGIWEALIGIAAIANDDFFAVQPDYAYELSTAGWGWVHLILGVVVLLTGLALFSGALWARTVGIFLAALVAINNFFFLPFYPIWSIVVIALAVFVIWSLATTSRGDAETRDARDARDYPRHGHEPESGRV